MTGRIRVAILEDHPATAEGYRYRLGQEADIEVVAVMYYGEELAATLAEQAVDVLLLDMQVATSAENPDVYPTMHLVPRLLERYEDLSVLVISMFNQRAMIDAVLGAGADGYVLKDDHEAYRDLPTLVRLIAAGGMYLSPRVRDQWQKRRTGELKPDLGLSPRQMEALSLCAAYPNERLPKLAARMSVANSTIRVLLWETYRKLGVNSRSAAVARARQIGLLPPEVLDPGIE